MVEWYYRDLQKWITDGCDKNVANQVITLNIPYCELKNIPKEIRYLTQLQILECSKNEIKEIPKEIRYIDKITKILLLA